MKKLICLLFSVSFLLTGCAALENMPKPPQVTPYPTETPPEPTPEVVEEAAEATPAEPERKRGAIVRMERKYAEAYDPENGTERILSLTWDTVRVDSELYPEAAEKITETLATLEDEWYTGSGSNEWNVYGYQNLLGAAEDDYALVKAYGGDVREYSAERLVNTVRADEKVCVFMIQTSYYLGGAHGSYDNQYLCFDAKSGERIHLNVMGRDPEKLKSRLTEEMLRLVREDETGYYEERLGLTEEASYEEAFGALLRDGSWYPGENGFWVFSSLYELGPYAAGITEFQIPYDRITDVLDSRWLPETPEKEAKFAIRAMDEVPEGSIEITDCVTVGEGGISCLLLCEGEAEDLSVETTVWEYTGYYSYAQLWFCGSLQDAAIQLEIEVQGDLPSTLLRYRDAVGEHVYLIGLSGEDGSLQLIPG